MEWQQVTQSFLPLVREQTAAFASPREMDLAIAAYNRAIRNLGQNSADIALIALRKLASDYPRFQEASLLYGCCLARAGDLEEARQQLLCTRQLPDLPPDLVEAADAALGMVAADLAAAASQPGQRSSYNDSLAEQLAAADLPPGSAPVVLERTGRRKKMQMASERERRDVMRQGDMPQQEETRVVMPRTAFETAQAVLPMAVVVLAAALLVFLGIRFLPGLMRPDPAAASAQERLDYLVAQLERRAPQDPGLQGILAEYSQRFPADGQAGTTTGPSAAATTAATTALAAPSAAANPIESASGQPVATESLPSSGTSASSPAETTAPAAAAATPTTQPAVTETGVATTTATTAATTTATTPAATAPAATTPAATMPADAPAVLLSASARYQDGLAAKPTDIVRAAEQFSQVIQLLAAIPPETTAPGVAQQAGQLRTEAQAQFDSVARSAALRLRSDAQTLFDNGQVAEALPIYLRAYALNPDSYGGGVAYYCGRCYQILGQPDQARPYFEYVVTHFAGRDIATSAAVRLREMGG